MPEIDSIFVRGYTFDDVLLIPKHSTVSSRQDVDLSVLLPKGIELKIPILSANMKTITDIEMSIALANLGGLPILHRFEDYTRLVSKFKSAQSKTTGTVGASVGIKTEDKALVQDLYNSGCKVICVDVAHGDHSRVCDFVSFINAKYPDVLLIAGNVATHSGADNLWTAGADIIKVGIGSGALCSTRIETGNGYPQLSSLYNICNTYYKPRNGIDPIFISDGGHTSAGDLVKALCFADLVMIGNLISGTNETPGNLIIEGTKVYKKYEGSSTYKPNNIEGVTALVPYKGSLSKVISKLTDGLKSGCSYQGAHNLSELKHDPQFVIISSSGLRESHPHDVNIIK